MELYETKFGICDHLAGNNPLASVRQNPSENHMRNFLYEGYLRNFLAKDLGKKLGMSFDEYISRPRYEMDIIHSVLEETERKKQEANKVLLEELQQSNQASKMKPKET